MKTFDWIIVGGGITGISLCEILTREGHSVALLEKNEKCNERHLPEKTKLPKRYEINYFWLTFEPKFYLQVMR